MSKNFWIMLIVVVGVLFGLFALTGGKAKTNISDKYDKGNILEIKDGDHKFGAGKKKVTVIEYGDFQCPSCGHFFPIVEQARQEYGDDITFVFRNFPITNIHPNAQAAARAAEAAANQGKFEEMYQQLYQTQASWSSSKDVQNIFESFAQSLKLNMDTFKADYASETVNSRIDADIASGKKVGVTGTPGIFVNGEEQKPPADYAAFKQVIDDAMAKAGVSTAPAPAPAATPQPAQ